MLCILLYCDSFMTNDKALNRIYLFLTVLSLVSEKKLNSRIKEAI